MTFLYLATIGLIFLILLAIGAISYLSHNRMALLQRAIKQEMSRAYEERIKYGLAKPKIERINEIAKEQIAYIGSLDRPSASASHSKYKNEIIGTIKRLEEEKRNLFQSILDGGSDPMLSVVIDGENKTMRISELLSVINGSSASSDDDDKKSESISSKENHLRLVIDNSNGEKDESSDT